MERRETAARRYAEAAFQIGRADGTLDAWERDLATLGGLLGNAELRRLLEHPAVTYADKEKVLRRLLGKDAVSDEAINLVLLMVRRGRPGAIHRMIDHFAELLRRERGVALAEVRTALPLDDDQRGAVRERLAHLTGQRIQIEETVDESLIGGIAVRIGDRLYDASVRSRLERLRARLTAS
jgi:F-type H+-transporting ATPase subunit delta